MDLLSNLTFHRYVAQLVQFITNLLPHHQGYAILDDSAIH